MALLEKQIKAIKSQLSGLETSQRLALTLCAVIIAGSLLWLSQSALQREMVPLHSEILQDDELAAVVRQLESRGEEFEEHAGTIYVRPSDKRRLVMMLFERNTGPKNLAMTFQDLIKNNNQFMSETRYKDRYNIALMGELAQTISTSDRIQDATVHVAREDRPKVLGKPASQPSASVYVKMAAGQRIDKSIVQSLAEIVAAAVQGLQPQNVRIFDRATARSYSPSDPEDEFASELYDLEQRKEQELQSKIEKQLNYIAGVQVSVSAKLDEHTVSTTKQHYDEPDVKREVREEEINSNQSVGGEPGVEANVSTPLIGSSGGSNRTKEKTETEFLAERGQTVTRTSKRPGTLLAAHASINIPRRYFIGAVKAQSEQPDTEPTALEVNDFIDQEKVSIRKLIEPILAAEEDPIIEVHVYSDVAAYYAPSPPDPMPQTANTVMDFVSAHGQQLGLAALALIALGMSMLIVRRAPVVAVPGGASDAHPDAALADLSVDGGMVGRATTPDGLLIAQETNETSVRARQVAQQVTDLINDDPESAAQLVRRWIEQDI